MSMSLPEIEPSDGEKIVAAIDRLTKAVKENTAAIDWQQQTIDEGLNRLRKTLAGEEVST